MRNDSRGSVAYESDMALSAPRQRNIFSRFFGFIFGFALVLAAVVGVVVIVQAFLRRRRQLLMERTLRYLDDLNEHRERIARRLQKLLDENVDGGEMSVEVNHRVKAVRRELKAIDDVIASFTAQHEKLARRLKR